MLKYLFILVLIPSILFSQEHRNAEQVHEYHKLTGYPHGRKGYVVDHIVPFCYLGSRVDSTWNYQWQRLDSSYTKNKYEVELCHKKLTFTQYEFIILNQKLVSDSAWKAVIAKIGK